MSKLSFVCFCIESYAGHFSLLSPDVYQDFKTSGLLQLLRDDYEDLHGMGREYMIDFCAKYLRRRKKQ